MHTPIEENQVLLRRTAGTSIRMDVDRDFPPVNNGGGQTPTNAANIGRGSKLSPSRADSGRTSSGQSVLNLVTCILGAGVLGFPYCFKSCGLILATAIMLVSLLATRFSYQLLLYCSQLSNKRSYEELAEQAVGKVGRVLVQLCTVALNLGAVVAYLNILADVISSVAGTIIPPGAEPSRSAYLAGVTLLGALPVGLLVRDHALVAAFSTASVGFIMLFATVIVVFSLLPAYSIASGAVVMWRSEGLLVAFPVMAYGFTAHPYYLGIFQNLNGSGVRKMAEVTDMGMSIAATLYWVVGIGGYMTFKARTSGDLLRNLGAAHAVGLRGAYERAIKLCYGLSILGAIPLVITPFHGALLAMMGPTVEATSADGTLKKYSCTNTTSGNSDRTKHAQQSSFKTTGTSRSTSLPPLDPLLPLDNLSRQLSHTSDPDLVTSHRGTNIDGGERTKNTSSPLGSTYDMDPVDLKSQQRQGPVDFGGRSYIDTSVTRHVLVVFVVLGVAMASAIWVPNVEFIFGLTGATASVIISYILPAITFIKLLEGNPELTQSLGSTSSLKANAQDTRWVWVWRKRQAMALLCFGLISGVLCTDAILGAVKEEAVVVQLAQRIAARQAAVQETTRVQQKAQQAVAAVSVVETASKQLSAAHINATDTIGQLQQAANALQAIASVNASSTGAKSMWDLHGIVKERNQHAAEGKVLKNVEATLVSVRLGMRATADSVALVVRQVNTAQAQFKAEKKAEDAAARQAETAAEAVADANAVRTQSKETQASDLAANLAKALGLFANVAQNETVAAGKSLEQVRATAVAALQALNTTINVLDKVSTAVTAAQLNHKHDSEIKELAAAAMQLALNATASSTLAMQMTSDALARSANEEASDLLSMLTQVATDMQKKRTRVPDLSLATTTTSTSTGIRKMDVIATSAGNAVASGSNAQPLPPSPPSANPYYQSQTASVVSSDAANGQKPNLNDGAQSVAGGASKGAGIVVDQKVLGHTAAVNTTSLNFKSGKSSNATMAKVIEDLSRMKAATTAATAAAAAVSDLAASVAAKTAAATSQSGTKPAEANIATSLNNSAPIPVTVTDAVKEVTSHSLSPAAAAAAATAESPTMLPPPPASGVALSVAAATAAASSEAAGAAAILTVPESSDSKTDPAASASSAASHAPVTSSSQPPPSPHDQLLAVVVSSASSESVSIEVSKVVAVLKDASAAATESRQEAIADLKETLSGATADVAVTADLAVHASDVSSAVAATGGGVAAVSDNTQEIASAGVSPSESSLTTFNTAHLRLDSVPTMKTAAGSEFVGASRSALSHPSPPSPPHTAPATASTDITLPTNRTAAAVIAGLDKTMTGVVDPDVQSPVALRARVDESASETVTASVGVVDQTEVVDAVKEAAAIAAATAAALETD